MCEPQTRRGVFTTNRGTISYVAAGIDCPGTRNLLGGYRGVLADWVVTGGTGLYEGATGSGTQNVRPEDDGDEVNRGLYRIGRDLQADGTVAGGWSQWADVPDWQSWTNEGAGVAITSPDAGGRRDLVVLAIDGAAEVNQGRYRIGRGLQRDEEASLQSVEQAAGFNRSVDRPERPRHPNGPLQFHVHVVIEAVRREREDDAGDHRSRAIPGQPLHEHEHSSRGYDHGTEEQGIVDEHRTHPGPEHRRRYETLDHHRIRKCQRVGFRIEDVPVEDRRRSGCQRMRKPGEPPHVEVHIPMVAGMRRDVTCLWPGHHDGERREKEENGSNA